MRQVSLHSCRSASMGHINTIGSLEHNSLSPKAVGSGGGAIGEVSCRSMATLSRLVPFGGEAPPPYEWTLSLSVEEVVSTDGGMKGWMNRWIDGARPQDSIWQLIHFNEVAHLTHMAKRFLSYAKTFPHYDYYIEHVAVV